MDLSNKLKQKVMENNAEKQIEIIRNSLKKLKKMGYGLDIVTDDICIVNFKAQIKEIKRCDNSANKYCDVTRFIIATFK
jgi:hypothetical protein